MNPNLDFMPHWRKNSTGETAREAAIALAPRAKTQRQLVLDAFAEGPATPETICERLERMGTPQMLMSVRPRCSELMRLGLIKDSGMRGKGHGGAKAIIWCLTTDEERAAWAAAHAGEAA